VSSLFADLLPDLQEVEVETDVKSRPYQQAAIDAVFEQFKSVSATLVVLPTGTGKSVVFAKVMQQWLRHHMGRVLILAHRKELILQAKAHAEAAGATCDIEMADLRAGKKARVVAASVQTLNASSKCFQCEGVNAHECAVCGGNGKLKRMTVFDPRDFGLVITDEGHHATAASYRDVYTWFARNYDNKRLFVTATPKRADGQGLHNVIDSVAYEMDLPTACDEGWLCVPQQQFIEVADLDLSSVSTKNGDLADGELERVFIGESDEEQERLLHAIVRPVLEIAAGKQFIVFASGVKHAQLLQAAFNAYRGTELQASVETLLGSTDAFERVDIVRRIKNGTTQGLVNVGVATEGFDCPAVSVIAIARPTKSESLYLQMIGRGTRPLPGVVDGPETAEARLAAIAASEKPFCVVLDFVGNSGRHKLMTVADCLAGADVDRRDIDEAIRVARQANSIQDMAALVEQAREAREKRQEEEERRRHETTHFMATRADVQQVAVPLWAGDKFDAFVDYTPQYSDSATQKQVAFLVRLGISPEKATTTTRRQAGALIEKLKAQKGGQYILAFGKHQGKKLSEVPRDYLEYIAKNGMASGTALGEIRQFLSGEAILQGNRASQKRQGEGE